MVAFAVSESLVLPSFFTICVDLFLLVLLLLEELIRVVPPFCPDGGFDTDLFAAVEADLRVGPAFCPDEAFDADLFTEEEADLRLVPAFCPDEGFDTGMFTDEEADLRVIPAFCPDGGFVTDLLVRVVFVRRVVAVLVPVPEDCLF